MECTINPTFFPSFPSPFTRTFTRTFLPLLCRVMGDKNGREWPTLFLSCSLSEPSTIHYPPFTRPKGRSVHHPLSTIHGSFAATLPSLALSYSSRRDFTAEAQRGKRPLRKTGRSRKGLNTKAPRHKGQRGKRGVMY